MPDATKHPVSEWRETEWLHHLQRQAHQLTACHHHADDLAHTCLLAFYDHHHCYPWQHPDPTHALRWCAQKLRALACDAYRRAQRYPCLALETLPESVACVDIAPQVQGDTDSERFLASPPPRLRTAVELRLAGYSRDEAAQQLYQLQGQSLQLPPSLRFPPLREGNRVGSVPPACRGNLKEGVIGHTRFCELWLRDWYRGQRQHLAGVFARIAGEIRGFFRIRPIETGF
jgi:DNA-directed RNA polymerase specialized sigma24 family protein